MRQHATELLSAHGIAFTFQGPAEDVELQVHADVRREVFLVFKEALNNLARHSGCARAHIELTRQNGLLLLRVSDDGKGLPGERRQDGHGLASMARRARALGATFDIGAGASGGTVVTLRTPLTPSRRPGAYARA